MTQQHNAKCCKILQNIGKNRDFMNDLAIFVALVGVLIVSSLNFGLYAFEVYKETKIVEDLDPETIQEQITETIQTVIQDQEKAFLTHENKSKGGVARSAAIRMKELDNIVGQGLIEQSDPIIKAAASFFPGLGEWLEANPDLAQMAFQKLSPFMEQFLGSQGSQGGNPQKKSGW